MHRWLAAAAVYGEPRIVAMAFLGFASGLPRALTASTLVTWLAAVGVDLAAIGIFAAVGLPYAFKFLWAPLIDRLPLPLLTRRFGRRRGWILATQAALIAVVYGLGASDPAANVLVTAGLAVLLAFTSASQDIVLDAYRIESLPERQLAAGTAVWVYGYRIAMLASGAGALYLAQFVSWSAAYSVMALLVLVGMVTVLLNPEPPLGQGAGSDQGGGRAGSAVAERGEASGRVAGILAWLDDAVVSPYRDFVERFGKALAAILLFILFYKLGDSLAGFVSNAFFVRLGFGLDDIASVSKVFGLAATLAGLAVGGWLMNAVGMYPALWVCGILQLLSNLMFAVQAKAGPSVAVLAATVGFENVAGGMGTAAFVAYLSRLCNQSYTATQFALLSSFFAFGPTLLQTPTGALAKWMGWFDFFLMTAVAALPGLALLWWLSRAERATLPAATPGPAAD